MKEAERNSKERQRTHHTIMERDGWTVSVDFYSLSASKSPRLELHTDTLFNTINGKQASKGRTPRAKQDVNQARRHACMHE